MTSTLPIELDPRRLATLEGRSLLLTRDWSREEIDTMGREIPGALLMG